MNWVSIKNDDCHRKFHLLLFFGPTTPFFTSHTFKLGHVPEVGNTENQHHMRRLTKTSQPNESLSIKSNLIHCLKDEEKLSVAAREFPRPYLGPEYHECSLFNEIKRDHLCQPRCLCPTKGKGPCPALLAEESNFYGQENEKRKEDLGLSHLQRGTKHQG